MQSIVQKWFAWQLIEVPRNILKAWKNFIKFGFNYFSVSLLMQTLFSPWHKYRWEYPRAFDVWGYFETFFSNLISRFLGMSLRLPLIIIGILVEIFILIFGFLLFLAWFLVPLALTFLFYHGCRFLF